MVKPVDLWLLKSGEEEMRKIWEELFGGGDVLCLNMETHLIVFSYIF